MRIARPAALLLLLALAFAAGLLFAGPGRQDSEPAVAFVLHDLDGNRAELPLAAAPLLVNFWATWCPPCRHELPLLDQAAAAGAFSLVAVAVDEIPAAAEYWREGGFAFPTLVAGLAAASGLLAEYGNPAASMPYTVLLDENGQVIAAKTGAFASVEEVVSFAAGS